MTPTRVSLAFDPNRLDPDHMDRLRVSLQVHLARVGSYWGTPAIAVDMRILNGPASAIPNSVILIQDHVDVDAAKVFQQTYVPAYPLGYVAVDVLEAAKVSLSDALCQEMANMAVNPYMNRLIPGPHPNEVDRVVLYAQEITGPVRGSRFEDETPARSSMVPFVTPAWFAPGSAQIGHPTVVALLPSRPAPFTLAPGGWALIFDPITFEPEIVFADEEAQEAYHALDGMGPLRRENRIRGALLAGAPLPDLD